MKREAADILYQYWGFKTFKPLQEDIIDAVLRRRDVLALLPTGGGKSVCFQVPALMQEGLCLVVSPLIALMEDQVRALKDRGIKAMALTGRISENELGTLLDNCRYGNYKFLYLSPERLQQELVKARLANLKLNLIAIDEAHCISQWGNDFRPAYKNIRTVRELLSEVPLLALTATATPEVITDTINELNLRNPEVFRSTFRRENLAYTVQKKDDKRRELAKILKRQPGPAIIYAGFRRNTEELSRWLDKQGFKSTFFHGGIDTEDKKKRLKQWQNNTTPVMVATNAFGMGIDKPDVRTVVHYHIPESMEDYFQETGRAGRDGEYAKVVLLYNEADVQLAKGFINKLPTTNYLKMVYRKLCNYFSIAYGEGQFTTHPFNFNHFCQKYELHTLQAYNALSALDRLGIVSLARQSGQKTKVQFLLASNALLKFIERDAKTSLIGKTILRLYTGIFDHPVAVNLSHISGKTRQTEKDIISVLQKLEKNGVITLTLESTDATLTFVEPREDDRTVNRVAKTLKNQNRRKEKQLAAMLAYVDNRDVCKSVQLLKYFGETDPEPCGLCSVCAEQKSVPSRDEAEIIAKNIRLLIEDKGVITIDKICDSLPFTELKIRYTVRLLTEKGAVEIKDDKAFLA